MIFVPDLMVMLAGLNLKPWIKTVIVGRFFAPTADVSARPAPPTSPSVPSFKNSLRVIAMQLPPCFRGRCAQILGACVFSRKKHVTTLRTPHGLGFATGSANYWEHSFYATR